MGVAVVIGLGIGVLVVKLRALGIGLLSAWGGLMLGFLLNTTFLVSEDWLYYVILIGCPVVTFVAGFYFENQIIIIVTALTGVILVAAGIGQYAGGFPDVSQLHAEIAAGVIEWNTFPKTYYYYLGGVAVGFLVSMVIQAKQLKKKEVHPFHKR